MILEYTGVVGIGKVLIFEDAVGTYKAGIGGGIEAGPDIGDAVGMAEVPVVEGLRIGYNNE